MRSTLLCGLMIALLLGGCKEASQSPEPTATEADGGAGGDEVVQANDAVDAAPAQPVCDCGDDDDCPACFAHLGQCCYGDPTFFGELKRISDNCDRSPACKACCSECLARSCEQMKAANDCPHL